MIGVIIGFVILTVIYYIILMTVRTPDMYKETVPPEAENVDDERYTGDAEAFGNNKKGAKGAGDVFGKFAEAFTGKKYEPKQVKPKKQFDDNNFKQLLKIASGKIGVLGFIL